MQVNKAQKAQKGLDPSRNKDAKGMIFTAISLFIIEHLKANFVDCVKYAIVHTSSFTVVSDMFYD